MGCFRWPFHHGWWVGCCYPGVVECAGHVLNKRKQNGHLAGFLWICQKVELDMEKDLLIEAFWITLSAAGESMLPGEIPRRSGQARRHAEGPPTCNECSVTELEWSGHLHCSLPVCNTAPHRDQYRRAGFPASGCHSSAAACPDSPPSWFSIKCNLKET